MRFSLAQANRFVIFTVSSVKIAKCDNASAGICLGGPDSWCFYVANRLVRAGNVRFKVADVTGNVKYIRNGDYGQK